MKKVISMLLFAAVAVSTVSCDEIVDLVDDLLNPGDEVTYTGSTTVSTSGVTIYTQEESTFILTQGDDEIDIEMSQIQFNANMPAMDIKISGIATDDGSFTASSIVPTLVGVPMDSYTISDISGSYSAETLSIDFVCLTLDVNFTGSAE